MYWPIEFAPRGGAALSLGMVLVLLAVSPICLGSVYRCAAKDGSISFSDSPCGPDAQVVTVKPKPAPAKSSKVPSVLSPVSGDATHGLPAGQTAADHAAHCVDLDQLDNSYTPADLYLGVAACIQQNNYRAAVAIFALAGMESHFDAARVVDKTAGQAGQALIMSTFDGLPAEKREKFTRTVNEVAADPQALARTCGSIRGIGFPSYYPTYMLLHGIHAFTAKPGDARLESTFDAAATWNSLLASYLNCH